MLKNNLDISLLVQGEEKWKGNFQYVASEDLKLLDLLNKWAYFNFKYILHFCLFGIILNINKKGWKFLYMFIKCKFRYGTTEFAFFWFHLYLIFSTCRYWANVAIPHGTNGFHAVCPFCASPLSGSPGYVRLIFQDNVDWSYLGVKNNFWISV